MNAHTLQDLKIMQKLPLEVKIRMTNQRIRDWINEFGEDGVYVSFSGGKDSTVLLDLVRKLFPNVTAVFVNTGLEYPEIVDFVKSYENVDILKPKMNFKKVVQTYGYPFISKEVSKTVYYARKYLRNIGELDTILQTDRQRDVVGARQFADLVGIDRRLDKENQSYQSIKKGVIPSNIKGSYALKLLGKYPYKECGEYAGQYSQQYDFSRYQFFLEAPFEIHSACCDVMKKAPVKEYGKRTGRVALVGVMAEESRLRTSNWIKNGCNAFELKHPQSTPMAFWTEQDVLQYIKVNNLPIASVYGEVVEYYPDQFEGQMSFDDYGLPSVHPLYRTTGAKRTGCMYCAYGCHLNNDQRFVLMKQTHPKQYEWIMKPVENGGLGYKEIIDWINEHGNLDIKY